MELDKVDFTILDMLSKDARTSLREIARILHVSPDTISNRFKTLEKQGIIRGSTVIIDPSKIGYSFITRFGINAKPAYSQQILEEIINIPSVIVASRLVGDHDLMAIVVAKNFYHISKIRDRIIEMPYVEKVDTSMWINTMSLEPRYFLI
jgi:Lrp/AsnC family transcriptional regulator for asnA, asnC and gidA